MQLTMNLEIVEESMEVLPEYGTVPIAFLVKSQLKVEVVQGGLGGFALREEPVTPYLKDYDALDGEGPRRWSTYWDIHNWGILSAFDGSKRIGGATIAWNTPGVNMLQGQVDLAVLWDLRIAPDYRGQGIGSRLFNHALTWARERGCRQFKVETQNINVPACRFYASQGCELGAIHRYSYGADLKEVQLLWYKTL